MLKNFDVKLQRPVHTEELRHRHRKNVTLMGKMAMQAILTVTGTVRKIKGADHQHYVDDDVTVSLGVNRSLGCLCVSP